MLSSTREHLRGDGYAGAAGARAQAGRAAPDRRGDGTDGDEQASRVGSRLLRAPTSSSHDLHGAALRMARSSTLLDVRAREGAGKKKLGHHATIKPQKQEQQHEQLSEFMERQDERPSASRRSSTRASFMTKQELPRGNGFVPEKDQGSSGVVRIPGARLQDTAASSAALSEVGNNQTASRRGNQSTQGGAQTDFEEEEVTTGAIQASQQLSSQAYYDRLPIKPGMGMLGFLGPLQTSNRNRRDGRRAKRHSEGLPFDCMDGKLYVPIPETVLFHNSKRMILQYSEKDGCVTRKELDDDWQTRMQRRWERRAKFLAHENAKIIGLLKVADWKNPEGSVPQLFSALTMKSKVDRRPPDSCLQRFIVPKGSKASVYRATWRRGKPLTAYNIISNESFSEATLPFKESVSELSLAADQRSLQSGSEASMSRHETSPGTGGAPSTSTAATAEVSAAGSKSGNIDEEESKVGTTFLTDGLQESKREIPESVALMTTERKGSRSGSISGPLLPRSHNFQEELALARSLCPSVKDSENVSVFKVSAFAIDQVQEALRRIVRHLEASISFELGLWAFSFDQLQCDFIKTESEQWVLTNIKGFQLTPAAYKEAAKVYKDVQRRKEEQGDYYDSDDEVAFIKARRKAIRKNMAPAAQQELTLPLVQQSIRTRKCRICARTFQLCRHRSPSNSADSKEMHAEASNKQAAGNAGAACRSPRVQKALSDLSLEIREGTEVLLAKKQSFEEAHADQVAHSHKVKTKSRGVAQAPARDFPSSSGSHDAEKQLEAPFEMTETMAQAMDSQLQMRGRRVEAFRAGIIGEREMIAENDDQGRGRFDVGETFTVCQLCYQVWEANKQCLDVARAHASRVLPRDSREPIHLPGDPGFGDVPGSVVGGAPASSLRKAKALIESKMLTISAAEAAARDESELRNDGKRSQYRVVLFFRDFLDLSPELAEELVAQKARRADGLVSVPETDPARVALQYSMQPGWTDRSVDAHFNQVELVHDSEESKTEERATRMPIRQARVHYLLASRQGLQALFMNKRISVKFGRSEGPDSRVFEGLVYLTRFLTQFTSRLNHSIVHQTVQLENKAGETLTLRCSVGVIRDNVTPSQLDPKMPLMYKDDVLYFPNTYFDLRPLPLLWIETILDKPLDLNEREVEQGRRMRKEQVARGHETFPQMRMPRPQDKLIIREFENRKARSSSISNILLSGRSDSDDSEWEAVGLMFDQISLNGVASQETIVRHVMERARKQLRKDGRGVPDKESKTQNSADADVDWIAVGALLQDDHSNSKASSEIEETFERRMSYVPASLMDDKLVEIARRRESECRTFTRDSLLDFLRQRLAEAVRENELLAHAEERHRRTSRGTSQLEADSSASKAIRSLGTFSRSVMKQAAARRFLRFRAYARIWASIDQDNSGSIDAAELRAYLRHRETEVGSVPRELYAKEFCDWSLKEMHLHFCFWLGTSKRAKSKFERYDLDASGSITWAEFAAMADEAFRPIASDELSFSVAPSKGHCDLHGVAKVYSIDLQCVKCELLKHDPQNPDRDRFAELDDESMGFVVSAAGQMLRRLSRSVADDSQVDHEVLEKSLPAVAVLALGSAAPASAATNEPEEEDLVCEYSEDSLSSEDQGEEEEPPSKQQQQQLGIPPLAIKALSPVSPSTDRTLSAPQSLAASSGMLEQQTASSSTAPDTEQESVAGTKPCKKRKKKTKTKATSRSKGNNGEKSRPQPQRMSSFKSIKSTKSASSRMSVAATRQRKRSNSLASVDHQTSELMTESEGSSLVHDSLSFLDDELTSGVVSLRETKVLTRSPVKPDHLKSGKGISKERTKKKKKVMKKPRKPRNNATATASSAVAVAFKRPTKAAHTRSSTDLHLPRVEHGNRSLETSKSEAKLDLMQVNQLDTLLLFAKHGSVSRAEELLSKCGPQIVNGRVRGVAPLHVAIENGSINMVRLLLAHGANPMAIDVQGRSPLQMAADQGNESGDLAAVLSAAVSRHSLSDEAIRI